MQNAHHGFAHPPRVIQAIGIEPGMAVADFGSGSGHLALLAAEALGNTGHVYAIDVQRDLLKRLYNEAHRRNLRTLKVIWGDLEAPQGTKLADGSVDLVLMSNILFQAEDRPALFIEASRVLRPGGRLVVIDWNEPSARAGGPRRSEVVMPEHVRALAHDTGFGTETSIPAGTHHYGLSFRKQ